MIVSRFKPGDLDEIELSGIAQRMSLEEFHMGKDLIRNLYAQHGGDAVTVRDDLGHVYFVCLLVRLGDNGRGLFVLYTTDLARLRSFRVLRLMKRGINAMMDCAKVTQAIAPVAQQYSKLMRFLGFELSGDLKDNSGGIFRDEHDSTFGLWVKNA